MMQERPPLDIATIVARCPVVVDRRLVTRLQLATLFAATVTWPFAILAMAWDWPAWAWLPTGIVLVGGSALLAALVRHVYRTGSFRLAADERRLYFREELGGGVRALDWHRCRHVELLSAYGERVLRFEFERHAGEGDWTSLCHTQVFLRDASVELIAMDLPAGARLLEQLEGLRTVAIEEADRGGNAPEREVA